MCRTVEDTCVCCSAGGIYYRCTRKWVWLHLIFQWGKCNTLLACYLPRGPGCSFTNLRWGKTNKQNSHPGLLKMKSETKGFTFAALSVNKFCPNDQGTSRGRHRPLRFCSASFKPLWMFPSAQSMLGTAGVKHWDSRFHPWNHVTPIRNILNHCVHFKRYSSERDIKEI